MKHKTLTPLQAYVTMFLFVEKYFQVTASGTIALFLGSGSLLDDGSTADPAIWGEWITEVNGMNTITPYQAFAAMHSFLKKFFDGRVTANVQILLHDTDPKNITLVTWQEWLSCIAKNDEKELIKLVLHK